MKRSKYTDEQILAIVKEGEAGRTPDQFAVITGSAHRLTPARPVEGRKPEGLSLSV